MKALPRIMLALVASAALSASGCSWLRGPGGGSTNTQADAAPAEGGGAGQPNGQAAGADARALFQRGMEAYRKNRDREAVEAFAEATRIEPDFAEAYYRLGLAHAALGEDNEADKAFKAAVEAYERVLKHDEKNAEALYFLGLAHVKLGEYEEAVKAFKESIKNSPEEDDDKYYELGLAHYKLAQYPESIKALNKALEINPDYYAATDALERAKAGRERREAFLEQLEKRRKQEQAKSNSNAAANSNANSATGAPRNTAAPTPQTNP